MFTRDLTDVDGIILITARGDLTVEELADHFKALRAIIAEKRQRGEPVRVLSDISEVGEQEESINLRILQEYRRTYLSDDRVALLVADTSTKLAARARLRDFHIAAFSSRLPAEMWLMADDIPPPRY